jgi:hypothetical protein
MSRQTAVEWLEQEFIALQNYSLNEFGLFAKAKEMEKEQILDAWQHGFDWGMMEQSLAEQGKESTLIDAKHYYNETFKD